jgi:hemoglobin/transferrin/lactoferrin receptor protein
MFTWIDGETLTFPTSSPIGQVEPIDRLMPTTWMTGLRWTSVDDRHWLELEVAHADRADRLSSRDRNDTQRIPVGGTPGYTVATLRGGWAISNHLSVTLALENLTDKNYRIHGSGLNEPGRNLVLSLMRR